MIDSMLPGSSVSPLAGASGAAVHAVPHAAATAADIQVIKDELRATLQGGARVLDLRTPLRELDPTGFAARVQWHLSVRTLGSDRSFRLHTVELTAHALHVHALDFSATGFRAGSTILHARLLVPRTLLDGQGTPADVVPIEFLGKVVKAVHPVEGHDASEAGFLLQVVQMDPAHTQALASLLGRLRTEGN